MQTTTYTLRAEERDGVSFTTLGHIEGEPVALLSEVIDGESTTIGIPLGHLARLGRVAQAALEGREPSPKNYDHKETYTA